MQEVEAICSRAIIIDLGKIKADDSIDNLLQQSEGKGMETLFHKLTSHE